MKRPPLCALALGLAACGLLTQPVWAQSRMSMWGEAAVKALPSALESDQAALSAEAVLPLLMSSASLPALAAGAEPAKAAAAPQAAASGVPAAAAAASAASTASAAKPASPASSASPASAASASEVLTPPRIQAHARLNDLPRLLGLPVVLPTGERLRADGLPPMSLMNSMAVGVDASLDVQASGARSESFDYTRNAAVGAYLPRLDARQASGRGRLESVEPWSTLPRRDSSLTFRQTLLDAGAMAEIGRQSKLAQSARIQWEGAGSSAGLEVASAYLQALQSRITMELSHDYEDLLVQLLNYVTERAKAGGTSNAERDRVKARVANARSAIADSRANLKSALRNLESLLGRSPDALEVGVPSVLDIPTLVEEAKSLAAEGNHDLRAARSEIDASGFEEKGYRARALPRFDVELSHTRNTNASGTDSYLRDTKAMLVMNWSLLNGGVDHFQASAAAARTREKKLREADARRKLDQELDAAYATLESLHDRFDSAREEYEANRSVVEAFRAQLIGGTRPLLDVLDADQRLYQSRLDLMQLAIGEVQNRIKVAHLTGRLPSLLAASAARP